MKKLIFSFLASLGILFSAQVCAIDNNSIIEANVIDLHTIGKVFNDGALIARSAINISCSELVGDGLISAPQMVLNIDTFNYTGTIECLDICELYVKNPFDENMFTRKGNGHIKIIYTQ